MAESIKRPIFLLKCGLDYVTSDLSLTGNINFAASFISKTVAESFVKYMEKRLETMGKVRIIPAEATINEKD
jgi:hypothetical protein